jgi:hypothetical protein
MYGANQQHTMRVPVDTTYRYGGKLNMALAFHILITGVNTASATTFAGNNSSATTYSKRGATPRSAVRLSNLGGGGATKAHFTDRHITAPV